MLPELEKLRDVEQDGQDAGGDHAEIDVVRPRVIEKPGRWHQLAQVADPDIALVAHHHSAVHGNHDCDLSYGDYPWGQQWVGESSAKKEV